MSESKVFLSAELVGMIFQYLPLSDIENFIENADSKSNNNKYVASATDCLKEFEYRVNPANYLGKYFKNARSLLFNMAEAGCILTASRALEHIVPGVTHSRSDWNFFVTPSINNIIYIMQCLEREGVVWCTKLQRLKYLVQFVPHITDTQEYVEDSRTNINERLAHLEGITIDYRNVLVSTQTIFGHILHKGKTVVVNLTYSLGGETPMELIKRMDHSAIQCFISSIGIGHLYYKTACRKETYLWTNHWSLGTVKKLYENSQYNIVEYDDFDNAPNCIERSLSDSTAKYINYANFEDPRVKFTCWYQFPNFLVHYNSVYEALDKTGKSQYAPKKVMYQNLYGRIRKVNKYTENYIIMSADRLLLSGCKLPLYI